MARPLLKKNEKGTLTRPPSIEVKIDAALTQDWTTLSRLARVIDPRSPDFLPSECLVHLIRDAIRRGEDRISSVLMSRLLNRAEANLLRTVPDSRMRDAEAVRQEILSSLALMFAEDGGSHRFSIGELSSTSTAIRSASPLPLLTQAWLVPRWITTSKGLRSRSSLSNTSVTSPEMTM